MILAEELTLLGIRSDGLMRGGADWAVTVALIVDLQQAGHVDFDKVFNIALTGTRPSHPALAAELDHLARRKGERLGTSLYGRPHVTADDVVDGLVSAGVLQRERRSFRRRGRLRVTEPFARERLLTEVHAAILDSTPLDGRMAALIALATPGHLQVLAAERGTLFGSSGRISEAKESVPLAHFAESAANISGGHATLG